MINKDQQEEVIAIAVKSTSWDMNKNKLAKDLKVGIAQAHAILLSEFYEHRVTHYKEIPDVQHIERDITFARKDYCRTLWNEQSAQLEHEVEITQEVEAILTYEDADLEATMSVLQEQPVPRIDGYTDEQVRSVIDNAGQLFQARTAPFVQMVLIYGETETKRLQHLTDKQFNRKLNATIKYIENNHEKFEILLPEEEQKIRKEQREMAELIRLQANEPDKVRGYLKQVENSEWVHKALQSTEEPETLISYWELDTSIGDTIVFIDSVENLQVDNEVLLEMQEEVTQ